jgi:hypothetical protein
MAKKSEITNDPKHLYTGKLPKGYLNLLDFFRNNMVEVKFRRKTPLPIGKRKAGHRFNHRRMICTSNWNFISNPTTAGMVGYESPKKPAKGFQWYLKRDLLITFDLLNADWRIIHLKDVEIIAAIPLVTIEDKAKFQTFYINKISKLTPKPDPRGNRRKRIADK